MRSKIDGGRSERELWPTILFQTPFDSFSMKWHQDSEGHSSSPPKIKQALDYEQIQ